jgi:hypothetical protein
VPIVATSSGLMAIVLTGTPEPYRGRMASTHAGVFAVLQAAGLLVEPVGLLAVLNGQAAVVAVAALVARRRLAFSPVSSSGVGIML